MKEVLKSFASSYRESFEYLKELSGGDSFFKHFPGGCCSLTAELMCTRLRELGVEADYVGGPESHGDGSHAWTVALGLVLDITADQFDETFPQVYVGEGLPLHSQYKANVMDIRLDCYDSALLEGIEAEVEQRLDVECVTALTKKKE